MDNHTLQFSSFKIENQIEQDCPFCKIVTSYENHTFIQKLELGSLFLNFNQSYRGRCLYIPHQHFNNLKDIPKQLFSGLNLELHFIAENLQELLDAELINIAMLGNKVRHIHWHLIPRYIGDDNWGHAPWPMKEINLSKGEMQKLISSIRTQLLVHG